MTRDMGSGPLALADRFDLVTYDVPGHGDAPMPTEPLELDDLSDQLAARLTVLGFDRAHVMGCGLGGMIAQCFAAAYPHRVDRLILCDTTPGLSDGEREAVPADLVHAAMARADLMDLAEEIYAPTLVLCAAGAAPAMREGSDFLARSIRYGRLLVVPDTIAQVVIERADVVAGAVAEFLTPTEPGHFGLFHTGQ